MSAEKKLGKAVVKSSLLVTQSYKSLKFFLSEQMS
jgi:hypothetical protein